MAVIDTIRKKVRDQEYEFTFPHFFEEMTTDGLIFADIESAKFDGKIRRSFTRDPRGTRYDIAGRALDGREIAVICRIKATGKLIVVDGVPAGVCSRCGEKVVKADVGRSIAALVGDSKRLRRARTMNVPVIRFAREVA